MKRVIAIGIMVISILAAIGFAVVFANPLRQSEARIRDQLLDDKPLGASIDDIRSWVSDQGWHDSRHHEQGGFY